MLKRFSRCRKSTSSRKPVNLGASSRREALLAPRNEVRQLKGRGQAGPGVGCSRGQSAQVHVGLAQSGQGRSRHGQRRHNQRRLGQSAPAREGRDTHGAERPDVATDLAAHNGGSGPGGASSSARSYSPALYAHAVFSQHLVQLRGRVALALIKPPDDQDAGQAEGSPVIRPGPRSSDTDAPIRHHAA